MNIRRPMGSITDFRKLKYGDVIICMDRDSTIGYGEYTTYLGGHYSNEFSIYLRNGNYNCKFVSNWFFLYRPSDFKALHQ